jgi:hypothetical protein
MPETAHQLALPLETHRNHYLFSDHYLNELLPRQVVWCEAETDAQQALGAMTATDRLIDRIVYRLHGLTDEEIAIVEGSAS